MAYRKKNENVILHFLFIARGKKREENVKRMNKNWKIAEAKKLYANGQIIHFIFTFLLFFILHNFLFLFCFFLFILFCFFLIFTIFQTPYLFFSSSSFDIQFTVRFSYSRHAVIIQLIFRRYSLFAFHNLTDHSWHIKFTFFIIIIWITQAVEFQLSAQTQFIILLFHFSLTKQPRRKKNCRERRIILSLVLTLPNFCLFFRFLSSVKRENSFVLWPSFRNFQILEFFVHKERDRVWMGMNGWRFGASNNNSNTKKKWRKMCHKGIVAFSVGLSTGHGSTFFFANIHCRLSFE